MNLVWAAAAKVGATVRCCSERGYYDDVPVLYALHCCCCFGDASKPLPKTISPKQKPAGRVPGTVPVGRVPWGPGVPGPGVRGPRSVPGWGRPRSLGSLGGVPGGVPGVHHQRLNLMLFCCSRELWEAAASALPACSQLAEYLFFNWEKNDNDCAGIC